MDVQVGNKNWHIHGINLVPSDAIYQDLVKAIEEGNLSQQHLQGVTGSHAPIYVNVQKREILLASF